MSPEKILVIPDVHIPYHDKKAWKLMLRTMKEFKPRHVVILGDFADFYDVSSHSKSPERRFKLDEEINQVKDALDDVALLGASNQVFIAGNHEYRLTRYLESAAPELHNIISIPKILELEKKKFKYVPYKESYKLGKMNFTHDIGSAGRYAHYKAADTFHQNIVIGHVHRMGYAVEGNAEGERHVSASFGWLGDAKAADYMHKVKINRDWCLGFGIGYLDTPTGCVYLTPVPIINHKNKSYSCLIEGKLYKEK